MDFITELNSGIVVDRNGLNKLKTADLAAVLSDIYSKGKPVRIEDNVRAFFGNTNLFRALEANADGLNLILEQRGVVLSDLQKAVISDFWELKLNVQDQLDLLAPPVPSYQFAEVPEGWSVDTHIKFLSKSVKRAKGNTDYTIGYKTLEKVWDHAAAVWTNNKKDRRLSDVQAGGYYRDVHVQDDRVDIGCQRVQRYELEQVALKQGWKFPEPAIVED